ncbi:hypothetical protein D9M71_708780 [compost metagenome]
MVVGVDQAGDDDLALEVQHLVRRLRQFGARPDLNDAVVLDEHPALPDFTALAVHRHQQVGVLYQECLSHSGLLVGCATRTGMRTGVSVRTAHPTQRRMYSLDSV